MNINKFHYILEDKNIALIPPPIRGLSNLLVINTNKFNINKPLNNYCVIDKYKNIYKYIPKDSIVILNNTKVIPSRIRCRNQKGKDIEIMFLESHNDSNYLKKAIVKGKVKINDILSSVDNPSVVFEVTNKDDRFISLRPNNDMNIDEIIGKIGKPPIPPYLNRTETKEDFDRYQTIFAKKNGSIAAPTASLNMTNNILKSFEKKGIKYDYITLHCGYGTFKPIMDENIIQHEMHEEYFECERKTYESIIKNKAKNQNIVAVGTTVTRTLEFIYNHHPLKPINSEPLTGETNLYLFPGKKFNIIDKLITNFHAPTSTPILLASAFFIYKIFPTMTEEEMNLGIKIFLDIYQYALDNDFKFLSYGDSMLIS